MKALERLGAREGDYVTAVDPPRLGLVLSTRGPAGKVELLIEDAARPCDAEAAPAWEAESGWTRLRRAGASG